MYGVPADLDLSFLRGAVLALVQLSPHQINFVFDSDARFLVEGDWELLAADGTVLDRQQPWPREEAFQLHRLLGLRVVGWTITPPTSLTVQFETGLALRLLDRSAQYESFTIEPGGIVV